MIAAGSSFAIIGTSLWTVVYRNMMICSENPRSLCPNLQPNLNDDLYSLFFGIVLLAFGVAVFALISRQRLQPKSEMKKIQSLHALLTCLTGKTGRR